MKYIIYLFLILSAIFLYNCRERSGKQREVNNKIVNEINIFSIDPSTVIIPNEYKPIDPIVLYDSLNERMDYTKKEFETSKEYYRRIDSCGHLPVYNNLTFDSLFTIDINYSVTSHFEYDADKGMMNAVIEFDMPFPRMGNNGYSMGIDFFPSWRYPYNYKEELNEIRKNFLRSWVWRSKAEGTADNNSFYELEFANFENIKNIGTNIMILLQ